MGLGILASILLNYTMKRFVACLMRDEIEFRANSGEMPKN
jgi:hypothetical protein